MKSFSTGFIVLFFCFSAISQQVQYQTYKSVMKVSAFKNGENYQWENKNVTVRLDYQIGSFITRLKNTDFYDTGYQPITLHDPAEDPREYELKGIFPIRDILNQKQINQTYIVELQLINEPMMLNRTMQFEVSVTLPNQSGAAQYRVFLMHGIMYNDEMQLPGFEGFDNEIEINIGFNAFSNNP